ncbi:MAG TPA: DNA-3-methyladenine glycosylase [Solirubrobacteraceae bacterium]|nr:DNA-3-methyladenine glycosylase [Solirubrobacteraceae bacterium]
MKPLPPEFYGRPVLEVAPDLIGCTVVHGETAGTIVETEAYHQEEPACHAYVGLTARTRTLFGAPGRAYVYRSYGIHAMLNAVCEPEGVGAAVLIRALAPEAGIELMRARRGVSDERELCSGPGRLTQALAIGLELNDTPLDHGEVVVLPREGPVPAVVSSVRVGITKAAELPWRFSAVSNPNVSRPWPWRTARGRRRAPEGAVASRSG